MRLIILLAVASCFLTPTSVSAFECFSAMYSTGAPAPIAIVDNRALFANYEFRKTAVATAKAYGLCVEDYGVKVDKIEPLTKKAVVWHKISGYSVWKNN